jgi:hypothetical protein
MGIVIGNINAIRANGYVAKDTKGTIIIFTKKVIILIS